MILDLTFRSFPGHNTVGLMCRVVFKKSVVRKGDAHEHEPEIVKSLQVRVRARP
jgi:hypothetical protein